MGTVMEQKRAGGLRRTEKCISPSSVAGSVLLRRFFLFSAGSSSLLFHDDEAALPCFGSSSFIPFAVHRQS